VEDALCFGGDVLTATDVAVATGAAEVGDPARLAHLDAAVVERAAATLHAMLDGAIDRMRTSREPVPVVLVGGGAVLVSRPLTSASEVIRPAHAGVANAIGAAHAEVGAEVERMVPLREREAVLAELDAEVRARVRAAGGVEGDVRIVDVEETAVSYLAEDTVRLRLKAVGRLDLEALS
jgi:hypothetical protein